MKMMAETKLVTCRQEVNTSLFYTILLFDRNYCFLDELCAAPTSPVPGENSTN